MCLQKTKWVSETTKELDVQDLNVGTLRNLDREMR